MDKLVNVVVVAMYMLSIQEVWDKTSTVVLMRTVWLANWQIK